MKLLIAILLVGFTRLAQAYTFAFDLGEDSYIFAENKKNVTWGGNKF